MYCAMEVAGVTMDANNQAPVVLLREHDGQRFLPIWVGMLEASSIAMALDGVSFGRPLTHDLFASALRELGCELSRVLISELKDNTFYAVLSLRFGAEEHQLDARPSDAIALALRFKAPIFCATEVLERAHVSAEQVARALAAQRQASAGDEAPSGERPAPTRSPPWTLLTDGELDDRRCEELLRGFDPKGPGKYRM